MSRRSQHLSAETKADAAPKVMSVAEMAAQLAPGEDSEPAAKPKKAAAAAKAAAKPAAVSDSWSPLVAQAKR